MEIGMERSGRKPPGVDETTILALLFNLGYPLKAGQNVALDG